MSRTVDERVVEMRFDNKQFENNVHTSLSTLEKLKQSLSFKGAAKGLDEVNDGVKKIDMSGLTSAVETVRSRFSALEVVAITALSNITTSIMQTSRQMLNSLTIAPIKQGFDEYELKLGSVQTIMASTGADLKTVNGYLQELNTYADKTIYSFSDMTSNIGKFTNSGVKLEDAVKAIKGVSNEAAVSGANAQEASRAMYNFAQALSAGSVKLIDWKSIENANMATVEFKQHLLDTAVALGTVVKEGDEYRSTTTDASGKISDLFTATSMFNESLSHQWMTTDVLIKTLGMYADETTSIGKKAFAAAQDVKTFTQLMGTLQEAVGSGWANTWEILFGDFNEAKKLWTELSNAIGGFIDKQSEARNNLLKNWKNLGGRKNVIDALRNSFKGLLNVLKPVKDAFTEIFPPITAKKLYSLSKQLKDISLRFKISKKTASDLKNTFKGLFAAADILKQIFVGVFNGVFSLSGNVTSLASKILSVTGAFGKWIVTLDDYIKKNNLINSSIQKVTSTINKIIETIRNFVKILQKKHKIPSLEQLIEAFSKLLKIIQKPFSYRAFSRLSKILEAILDKTNKASKAINGFFTDISDSMKKIEESMSRNPFVKVLKKLWNICVDIAKKISKVIGKSFETLADKIESLNAEDFLAFFNSLVLLIKTIGVSKIFKDLGERVESFQNIIDQIAGVFDGIKDAEDGIVEILNSVRGCFEQYQKKLKAETLKTIAIAIGILAASIFLLSTINAKELKNAIEAISVMFIELISGMAILSKISKNSNDFYRASSTMIALSFSMLILSSALKKISVLKPDELKVGLLGIAGMMVIMVASLKLLGKDEKKVIKGAAGIIAFSVAVRILTKACVILSKLSWENLLKGLVGVGALLAEISLFLKFTKFNKKTIAVSSGIVILALAIKILANVCKDFSEMSWEGLAKGLSAIGILLAEISAFANLTSKTKHIISTSISLTIMGAALKIIASVLKDLSVMRWEELAKGISGISGALASIVSALNLMPKDAINKSIALTVIGSSIKVLSYCLKEIASMSWEELAKSLLGLAGALTSITMALNFMPKNMSKIGNGLLLVSASLLIISKALTVMGSMSWEELAKSLLGLAGALISITMALNFMPKNMVKIGTGLLMVSASLLVMSKALTVMGSMSWEEIAKSVTTLAGAMAILSVSLILMKKTSAGASALLIASAAISVLVPSLKALGSMSIGEIAASLIGMAGAFVVLGAASAVLGKMLPQTFALSVSIALIGAGIAAVGVGLVFAGLGLQEIAVGMLALGPSITVLTTEFLAALGIIYSSMDSVLIPLSKKSGELIAQILKSLLKSVIESLPEIKTLIFDVLKIIFDVALEALKLSKGYIPKMVEYILDLVVNILKSITKKLPGLIKAVVDLLVALFTGVINALNSVDPEIFVKGILGLAFITAMMMALSYIAGLVPGAIAGALGASAVIAEITAMLAAFGALAQIPGLKWIVEEGGEFLQSIGTAIGQFLGGIAGGFASGMSSKMSRIGADLSDFMMNAEPFIEGAKKIDSSAMNGISALADAVLALTASNVLNGITSFFGIKASLSEFGNELSVLGSGLSEYYRETKNVDGSSIEKSSKGIAALFDMTKHIPNRGGLIGLVFGEKNLKTFANELPKFGLAIKLYSQKVSDIDSTAVIKSAEACEILFDMLKNVPTTGGLMSMIFGETDVLGFAKNLSGFGSHLKKYGKSVKGVDVKSISNSAKATEALSTMVKNLPTNQSVNPVISWFTGQKNLVKFGETLELFAPSLKRYSVSIKGLNGKLVINSAKATEALSTMVKNLPTNQSVNPVISWFTGQKNLVKFGETLELFAPSLKRYSDKIKGINADLIKQSANATETLSALVKNLPTNQSVNPVISWFTGQKNLVKFGETLELFAPHLKKYSDEIKGINADLIKQSAAATEVLSNMVEKLPPNDNLNAISTWFNGALDLEKFGYKLSLFAPYLKKYSDQLKGIDSEVVVSSAKATEAVGNMVKNLPANDNLNAVSTWFNGTINLEKFGYELSLFAPHFKKYADVIGKINSESVIASANATKSLVEMIDKLPPNQSVNPISSWFTGEKNLVKFGETLELFAPHLKAYASKIGKLDTKSVESSANAAKILTSIIEQLPPNQSLNPISSWFTGEKNLNKFGETLELFAPHLKAYVNTIGKIDTKSVESSANAAKTLTSILEHLPPNQSVNPISSWFTGEKNLNKFGETLELFAPHLKAYANTIGKIDTKSVESSANAAKVLTSIIEQLPPNQSLNPISSWFTGEKNLNKFGETLELFAPHLKKFTEEMNSIKDFSKIEVAARTVTTMIDVQKSYSEINISLLDLGYDINEFGKYMLKYYSTLTELNLNEMAKARKEVEELIKLANDIAKININKMNSFGNSLKNIANDGINSFINAFTDANTRIRETAINMLKRFIAGAESKKGDLTRTFSTLLEASLNSIESKENSFKESGKKLVDGFIGGVSTKTVEAISKCITLATDCYTNINNKRNDFLNAGINLVEGFADGISAKTYLAKAKSAEMARAAVEAARRELNEHSPSKVFYSIGDYAGMGFINALADYANRAYSAGSEIAVSAKDGLKATISKLSQTVNEDFDTQPTIRPVIDLTNVSDGVKRINDLFNADRSIMLAKQNGLDLNASFGNGNAKITVNNGDVVKAIKDLRSDIYTMSKTISRMKLVMDTGTLVGALVGPMDDELGRRAVYGRRGN